jgi:hypothetical protein
MPSWSDERNATIPGVVPSSIRSKGGVGVAAAVLGAADLVRQTL